MKTITLAATALNQTPLAWRDNAANIRAAISSARKGGGVVVCLPELCLSGYGCEDAFLSPNTHQQAWASLRELLPETHGLVVSFGLPIFHHNTVFNAAALAVDGKLVALICKRHLAGDGIHYEPRWFKPWPLQVRDVFHAPDNHEEIAIGDLVVAIGGVRVGFEICEDAWVARRPGGDLAAQAVDLILNPSASHFAFGKREIRRRFVVEGSRAFNVSYVYSNLLGNEAGRAIYDGQTLIASAGELIAEGPRFSYQDQIVTIATVDLDLTRLAQSRATSHRIQLPDANHPAVVRVDFKWPDSKNLTTTASAVAWENSSAIKEEEFARAVSLALFDYLRKSHTRGFTVSLSGGADSAAVVCLIHLMVRFMLEDEAALKKIPFLSDSRDAKILTSQLLTTAYQATEHSGEITKNAAAALAEAIGATHHELDIAALHQSYLDLIGNAVGRKLDWQRDDIALQNIQARVRSPGIWMIANLTNTLLLSTSNRSEAAVGYATMDGDTSGSVAPIAGIDKAFLRKWLRWLETDGPRLEKGRVSIPALAAINQQQPTAELRPADATQTDEDDLMPYAVLDVIERAAIRDKRGPADVFFSLQREFPKYTKGQLLQWLNRFFQLWSRNQWKRERYAPSFHLDDQNLDPKTGCRWPILSGGFGLELSQLNADPTILNQSPRSVSDVINLLESGIAPRFLFFWGLASGRKKEITKSCFSQWWNASFEIDGIIYPTAEHYMMASKARLFGDMDAFHRIIKSDHPKEAKKLGRSVKGFDEATWIRDRVRIVQTANEAKFRQNSELSKFLLSTGDVILVEASPVDRIWGIGLSATDADIHSPKSWQGLNLLGFALMEVRDRIRNQLQ